MLRMTENFVKSQHNLFSNNFSSLCISSGYLRKRAVQADCLLPLKPFDLAGQFLLKLTLTFKFLKILRTSKMFQF